MKPKKDTSTAEPKQSTNDQEVGDEDELDEDLNELDDLEDEYMDEDLLSLDSYYSGKLI